MVPFNFSFKVLHTNHSFIFITFSLALLLFSDKIENWTKSSSPGQIISKSQFLYIFVIFLHTETVFSLNMTLNLIKLLMVNDL